MWMDMDAADEKESEEMRKGSQEKYEEDERKRIQKQADKNAYKLMGRRLASKHLT